MPGIEAQLAPNNYIFSHSLLYAIDPFTDTGLMATVKLNDQWLVQLGITGGHDVALWTPDAKPSGTACLSYTTKSVNDNFYICANGINDGKYAYNNLQQYDATWYHKFSKTVHMATESWYMYERDVPALGGTIQPETGANARVLPDGGTALHRSRICHGQFSAEGTLTRMTSCRFAVTFSTTRKASVRATRPDIQRTRSRGVIGSAQRSRYVRNCVSSVPGIRRLTTTVDGTIS